MVAQGTQGPAGPVDDVEVEWQLDALDLRPVERWLAALPGRAPDQIPTLTVLAKPTRRLVDRYLDTEDWRVGRAGLVLRTRHRGRRDEATLKDTAAAATSGLRRRLEVSEALPTGGIDELGDSGPVGRRLAALTGRRTLRLVVEVRTRRRPFALRVDTEEVGEIALDETTIAVDGQGPPVRLRRVEVEVVPSWVGRLEPVVDELRETCGLQPAKLSKFEAGLLALGESVPGPPDLGPTSVGPESSLGDLAYAMVRRQLGVLVAREPGTRLGEDIEDLHDMRVATRRLRAALDLFAGVLPARAAALRSELSWIAGALGAVRDLDVQLERMDEMEQWVDPWAHGGPEERSPLFELRQLLEDERRAARRVLIDALDSARWDRLTSGLEAMVRQPPARRSALYRSPAVAEVVDLVEGRHRAVDKAARRAKRTGVAGDFHRLRIRCKRLRYSLEFTADLYEGSTERYTRRLARVQDRLGLMQDAEVATNRLLALARTGHGLPPTTVFAMGGVAERYRTEAAGLLDDMAKRLKVLGGGEWRSLAALMEERRDEARRRIPSLRLAPAPPPAPGGPAAPGPPGPSEPVDGAPTPGASKPAELARPPAATAALAAWPDPVWGPPGPTPGPDPRPGEATGNERRVVPPESGAGPPPAPGEGG